MANTGRVLASLLARAYVAEFSEAEVISETLMQVSDDGLWDSLFNLIRDNEIHRLMIEEAVKLLGFDVKNFREYSARTVSVRSYEFSDEYITTMLEEILKWEVWALKYYSHLLNLNFSEISREFGEDVASRIQTILKDLVTWENKHVNIVKELLQK
jgi:hypothetical protein